MDPIYCLPINSLEQMEQILNDRAYDNARIARVIEQQEFSSVEKMQEYLDLSGLFREGYNKTLGLITCAKVSKGLENYRKQINQSLKDCRDLAPLFLSSFQHHQIAFDAYVTLNDKKIAIDAMAKTAEVAKSIAHEYKRLSQRFETLTDESFRSFLSLNRNLHSLKKQKREKERFGHVYETALLEKGIASSECAVSALTTIQGYLLEVKKLWEQMQRHSEALGTPSLADLDRVELIEAGKDPETEAKSLFRWLETVDDASHKRIEKEKLPPKDLSEIIMRTGIGLGVVDQDVVEEESCKRVRFIPGQGIKNEFEDSYVNWMTLAKVHQVMIKALQGTLEQVEMTQDDIFELERDPLVKALHAASGNLLYGD